MQYSKLSLVHSSHTHSQKETLRPVWVSLWPGPCFLGVAMKRSVVCLLWHLPKWILSSKWQSRSTGNRRRYCTPWLHRFTKRCGGGWSWIAFLLSLNTRRLPPWHRPVYTAPAMNAVLMVGCPCEAKAQSVDFLICHFVWPFIPSPPLQVVISPWSWLTHDSLPGVLRVIIN